MEIKERWKTDGPQKISVLSEFDTESDLLSLTIDSPNGGEKIVVLDRNEFRSLLKFFLRFDERICPPRRILVVSDDGIALLEEVKDGYNND